MSKVSDRIAELGSDKRDLLIKVLQRNLNERKREAEIESRAPVQEPVATFDVVVMGGGLAGQTLARQIKRCRPATKILVTELRPHPVNEAAHKVGESSVEIGAHYFSKVLDLEAHLTSSQLRKAGLRYFFPNGSNEDIATRVEMGASFFPPTPSFQIDRGRFENFLGEDNVRLGIEFWDRSKSTEVTRHGDTHCVSIQRGDESFPVAARWVVDASGRAGLLKRQLGLARESGHHCNAVWFRIAERIDIDEWSTASSWRERIPEGLRWLSTNHLMGRGYWVWLIPLAGGITSVGIVADPDLHPLEEMRSFERALEWLKRYEPQCAREVEARRTKLMDFLAVKHFAHGCARVFSGDRWALTGEAGVFTDPFYSPGSDFIAMGNTFITDLILRDLAGEDIVRRANDYNRIYLNTFESFITIYEGQYGLMGSPQVMAAKIVWDFAIYWGFLALQFIGGRLCDLDLLERAGSILQRINHLNARVQLFFREWDKLAQEDYQADFIDVLGVEIMRRFHYALEDELPGEALVERFGENLKHCESLAAALFGEAVSSLPGAPAAPANPYEITLDLEHEGLFDPAKAIAVDAVATATMQSVRLKSLEVSERNAESVCAD